MLAVQMTSLENETLRKSTTGDTTGTGSGDYSDRFVQKIIVHVCYKAEVMGGGREKLLIILQFKNDFLTDTFANLLNS